MIAGVNTSSQSRQRRLVSLSLVKAGIVVPGISLLLLTGCGWGTRKVNVGEEFTLHPNEKVRIAGADLTIQLDKKESVGRQWYVNGRPEAPYVRLTISSGGADNTTSLTLGDSKTVGEYSVKLIAANPDHDHGGPDCKLIITPR